MSLEEEVKLLPVGKITNNSNNKATNGRGGGGSPSSLIGGRIFDDLPYIHYRFQVEGLLFCPKVGMKLTGQVMECTPTFVTLTTHHILSTKISTEKLVESGFVYDAAKLEWVKEREDNNGSAGAGATGKRGGDNENSNEDEEEEDVVLGPTTSIYLDYVVDFVVDRIHECGGYISLDGKNPSVVSTLGNK